MPEKKPRTINTPEVGWMPISYDFGRDQCWALIEDEDLIISAAGLYVSVMGLCMSANSNWVSRLEVLRSSIPGSSESKLAAVGALCQVGLFVEEEMDNIPGWSIDISSLLEAKNRRYEQAKAAAEARHRKKKTGGSSEGEENPPVDEPWA